MTKCLARARFIIGALALVFIVAVAAPAVAQQPSSVNPTASAVKEDQLLNQMKIISGRGTLPDAKSYNLEQPEGRKWQDFRRTNLPIFGAVFILGALLLLVVFYLIRGMVKIENGRSGRMIIRFNAFERFVHWMSATCFVVLAITGLNITFGRPVLLPLIGLEAFSTWSQWAKYAHNYLSFPFTLGVILILLMWIAGNIPNKVDVDWLKRGGGIVGHDHPHAYRFNAGQKMIYWIVVLGGGSVAASGYLLMFPFYGTGIEGMQLAQIVHGVVAVMFVAAMLGHIYIGTIGMEGAFEGMAVGEVDLNWAKQHHDLWLIEEQAKVGPGESQRQPLPPHATPAE
jgi:formate dehydrogenase subunit gamma